MSDAQTNVRGNSREGRLLFVLLVAIAGVYLLQARSPLRINHDAYRLLSMAVSAHDGVGFLVDGRLDQYPTGYPVIVRTLLKVGVASSAALVLVNLVFLSVTLVLLVNWASSLKVSGIVAVLVALLSVVTVKHVTLPLTDLVYLGWSCLSLSCALRFFRRSGPEKWLWFLGAAFLAWVSVQTRTFGLANFAALGATTLLHRDFMAWYSDTLRQNRRLWRGLGLVALLGLGSFALLLGTEWYRSQFSSGGSYFQGMLERYQSRGFLETLSATLRWRVHEMGELLVNVPAGRVPAGLRPVYYLVGAVGMLAGARGAYHLSRSKELLPLAAFLFSSVLLLVVWPAYGTRFWLPIMPVLILSLLAAANELQSRWPWTRVLVVTYAVCFVGVGLVGLAFSTRISLAGREFSELYGDGTDRMTYRAAFQNGMPVDSAAVDPARVRLLQIFDPLADSELQN